MEEWRKEWENAAKLPANAGKAWYAVPNPTEAKGYPSNLRVSECDLSAKVIYTESAPDVDGFTWLPASSTVGNPVGSYAELDKVLEKIPKGSLDMLVITGHSAQWDTNGGVRFVSNEDYEGLQGCGKDRRR